MKVLLVEDDKDTREVLRAALEKSGHEVVEAADGSEGLERLQDSTPDIVLLDILMPVMDGFGFLVGRKQLVGPGAKVPVVVLSRGEPISHEAMRGLEIARVLQKPVTRSHLDTILREAVKPSPSG
jgi:CheY-like chemotaxis protein